MKLSRLQEHIKSLRKKVPLPIGELVIDKIIGQGGNGVVYLAELHGHSVAVKVLVSDMSGKSYDVNHDF